MKNYLINFLIRISSSRTVRIVSIYFIVSALWIFFSDTLVYNFPISEELRAKISIIKGWGFVLVTSSLLFSLISSALKEAISLNSQIDETEKRYKLISDNTTDVIWAYDLESERLTYASPSVEKLLGYTPKEILKLTVKDFLTAKSFEVVSSSLPERIKDFENAMDSAKSQIFEAHLQHKNGSIVSAEIVTTLIKDNSGKVIELVGVSRDITDRKRMGQER